MNAKPTCSVTSETLETQRIALELTRRYALFGPIVCAARGDSREVACEAVLMVSSKATTVAAYLAALPDERRAAISAVRDVILANLPRGYEEGMQHGMIAYAVPLSRYPFTYNREPLMIAALASQKQYMSLYLMGVYGDPEIEAWFTERYRASGKKLDMGKSCVRFRKLDDLPLDLVGEVIARISVEKHIARTDRARGVAKKPAPATKKRSP